MTKRINRLRLVLAPCVLLTLTTGAIALRAPTPPLKDRVSAAETVFLGKVINRAEDGDWVRAELLVEQPLRNAEKGMKIEVTWRTRVGSFFIYDVAEGTRGVAILKDKHKGRYWLRADKFEDSSKLAEVKAMILPAANWVIPQPQRAEYSGKLLDLGSALACVKCDSKNLKARLAELADRWGVPMVDRPADKPCTRVTITFAAKDDALARERERGEQGYVLTIAKGARDTLVTIHGGDEAGAFYGLQSLRQLVVKQDGKPYLRSASIKDWPAIKRRGLIFGCCDRIDSLVNTLDFCSSLKLNYFLEIDVRGKLAGKVENQVRACKSFCDGHYIEQCALMGYRDRLTKMPRAELLKYFDLRYRLGFRSFTVNFDDTGLKTQQQAQATADKHADIVNALYQHLRGRDPKVQLVMCPIPYGGRPDKKFCFASVAVASKYLNVIEAKLPKDVAVFWTGDEGVWSSNVTAEGARLFGGVIGRKPFMWDNNPIRFANKRQPLSGRQPKLYTQLSGYVANLNEHETRWRPDHNVQFTLATIAMYTWNPEHYNPEQAAAAAAKYLSKLYPSK